MSDEPVKRARTLALTPVCRLCASSSEELIQIFSNEGIQKGLPEKVARCLPILISENDDLPTTICPPCSQKLESVRSFFESCFNSNQSLVIRLRKENGVTEVTDLETQVNLYVRHFTNGPIASPIKLEPSSYCDVDLSVPEEEQFDEELGEEEEEDLEEDFEEADEEDEYEPDEEMEEQALRENKDMDGVLPMNCLLNPVLQQLIAHFQNNNGSKEKVAKRGRKPLVSLSLKTCAECGEEFQDHASNLNHWKEKHPDKETFYKCTHKGCDFESKQTDEVNKHRFRHKDRTKLAARNLST
ncbi:unnamed protein product [Lepeophtheirus salmonis]|nr:unnamed protein product [Lepeophtheirus salmonis]CAF2843109.1 unnamed protein product [Lepeophtheirus salmonis]